MLILFLSIFLFVIAVYGFVRQPKFGEKPSGERLERIKKSAQFRDGAFQNLNDTPALTEGVGYLDIMKEFFLVKKERIKPTDVLPSIKTDLLHLDSKSDVLVWFGHSSYFMQIDGKKILVDPVFSGAASPIAFMMKAFEGADVYTADDMPPIDYLFISHDHWDHLDYETILKLKPKIGKVVCSLGTGAHLERWGYDPSIIIEKEWNEKVILDDGFEVNTTPARHFSGRSFQRNQALWTSFVFQTPTMKIFIGGDSGYDTHFAEIGQKFGEFDLVILENGQYDKNWKYIHATPIEVLQAAKDLNAKRLLPVHSSKFPLANHAWDEPLRKITEFNETIKLPLLTPMIGEQVNLKDTGQIFSRWWEKCN